MSGCELLFCLGVISSVASIHLCYTREAAWQEVNSSGLRVMRSPECEGGFICLFGHVCWAGGFYLNNSTPMYREPDLSDRDQLHPHHREPGRERRRGTRDERNHRVVKTTESLEVATRPVNWLSKAGSDCWADSSGKETLVTFMERVYCTKLHWIVCRSRRMTCTHWNGRRQY